jgi:hypothetical protein
MNRVYTINTVLTMHEHAFWHSTRPQPTVTATVTNAKPTRAGMLYTLEFTANKPLNGVCGQCWKVLNAKELGGRLVEVVSVPKKTRTRKSGNKAA